MRTKDDEDEDATQFSLSRPYTEAVARGRSVKKVLLKFS